MDNLRVVDSIRVGNGANKGTRGFVDISFTFQITKFICTKFILEIFFNSIRIEKYTTQRKMLSFEQNSTTLKFSFQIFFKK